MLPELDHRLARRVLELEAGGLELAVVQAAPIPELQEHLGGELQAGPPERHRGEPRTPRREDRERALSEQADHLREGEHAVRAAL
jgi:hypothetical protein